MTLAWPAWILVICAVIALVCVAYGALRAIAALRIVKKHSDALRASPLIARATGAQNDVNRIRADVVVIQSLVERSKYAIAEINQGFADLRIPQAVAAMRTANAAVRLLFSGR